MTYLPDAENIYLGTTGVTKVMLGDEQVWPYINPFEVPSYVSGNTVAFKYLGASNPSANPNSVSLYNCYKEPGESHLSLNINLFSDYNGDDLVPTNAAVTVVGYLKSYTVNIDENGWALFKFDRPVHTIACAYDSPSDMSLFAVIPDTVKVLAGFYGTVNTTDLGIMNRYYIPEGVEVLSGNCVYKNAIFNEGSVHIPSTVTTIGYAEGQDASGNTENCLCRWHNRGPKLFYYNGTYDDYNNITWLGKRKYTYTPTGESGYAGYPVKCTDGVYARPKILEN